jgi:hypothetical protein
VLSSSSTSESESHIAMRSSRSILIFSNYKKEFFYFPALKKLKTWTRTWKSKRT